jgi:hypothetical protein
MLDELPEVLRRDLSRSRQALWKVLCREIMLQAAAAGGHPEAE